MSQQPNRSDLHKHLEFIQNVIARLANNSFLMKGWAITVSGAFYGFGVQQRLWGLAAIGLVPAFSFWWLDGYFLRAEKMFRRLYDEARTNPQKYEPFDMDASPFQHEVGTIRSVMWSDTLRVFHGSLVLAGIAIVIALAVLFSLV